jgi:hypothetical protein
VRPLSRSPGHSLLRTTYDPELPLANELRAFLQPIGRRSGDASHFELGMAIAQAIESAEESIRKGALP